MNSNTRTSDAVRVWIGISLCDSNLSYIEENALEKLFESTSYLTGEEKTEARRLLHNPRSGALAAEEGLQAARRLSDCDLGLKEEVYQSSRLLAVLDGPRLSASERSFLGKLAEVLGVAGDRGSTPESESMPVSTARGD